MKQGVLSVLVAGSQAADSIAYVHELVRHGARAPLIPADNGKFPVDAGMLTPMGARERALIGRVGYEKYIKSKFLSEVFDESEVFYYADDVLRTIQSAKAEVSALYPPGTGPQLTDAELKAAALSTIVPIKIRNKAALDTALGSDAVEGRPQNVPVFNIKKAESDITLTNSCPFVQECDDYYYKNPKATEKYNEEYQRSLAYPVSRAFNLSSEQRGKLTF